MVLGNTQTTRRLNANLSNDDVDMVHPSRIPEILELIQREQFDIALVDSQLAEAGDVCHLINQYTLIPVALLIPEQEVNWHQLNSWEVDGFVSNDSSQAELLARIKAIARRIHLDQICLN